VLAYVEGDLIHKDTCLSVADRAHYFCPCVSRARSRIVLPLWADGNRGSTAAARRPHRYGRTSLGTWR